MEAQPNSDTWQLGTTSDFAVSGYLPSWAEEDPSQDGVEITDLGVKLADIVHSTAIPGQYMRLSTTDAPAERSVILSGSIDCRPYAADPDRRVPVANLQLVDDYWMHDLDPDQLAEIAVTLREQADHLYQVVRPSLVAARADWTARGN